LFQIRKAKMAKKVKEKVELPKVHKDLEGFDVTINSFGEIQMSYNIEKINDFLNNKVEDKKLKHLKEDEKS
jgi:putative NADH-flavin reductase